MIIEQAHGILLKGTIVYRFIALLNIEIHGSRSLNSRACRFVLCVHLAMTSRGNVLRGRLRKRDMREIGESFPSTDYRSWRPRASLRQGNDWSAGIGIRHGEPTEL